MHFSELVLQRDLLTTGSLIKNSRCFICKVSEHLLTLQCLFLTGTNKTQIK